MQNNRVIKLSFYNRKRIIDNNKSFYSSYGTPLVQLGVCTCLWRKLDRYDWTIFLTIWFIIRNLYCHLRMIATSLLSWGRQSLVKVIAAVRSTLECSFPIHSSNSESNWYLLGNLSSNESELQLKIKNRLVEPETKIVVFVVESMKKMINGSKFFHSNVFILILNR